MASSHYSYFGNALQIKNARATIATSGNTEIVAAVTGYKIGVVAAIGYAAGNATITWKDGTTSVGAAHTITASNPLLLDSGDGVWILGTVSTAFQATAATNTVEVTIKYVEVPA